jgi:hypothetical protein
MKKTLTFMVLLTIVSSNLLAQFKPFKLKDEKLKKPPLIAQIDFLGKEEQVNKNKIKKRFLPPPGNDCSTAATMPLPSSIPTCQSIMTTPAPIATTGNTGVITTLASSAVTPLPASGCYFYSGYTPDSWYSFTLPTNAGGFILNAALASGYGFYGTTTYSGLMVQAYTGADCGSLSLLGSCESLIDLERLNPATGYSHTTSGGGIYITNDESNTIYSGLAPGTTIWLRLYSYRVRWTAALGELLQDGGTNSNFVQDNIATDISISLLPTPPSNATCASCAPGTSTTGCNLGSAPPAPAVSWVAPSHDTSNGGAGIPCGSNNWFSVDNPVYFCVQASTDNPSIQVSGVVCNGAPNNTLGIAQFGAFADCASIGDYTGGLGGSSFKGCAAGNGTVTLTTSGITSGSNFIIVVDGNAGDMCTWNFNPNGVILPLKLIDFSGHLEGKNGILSWKTSDEIKISHFELEKSKDGINYYTITKVDAQNKQENEYSYFDDETIIGNNYYRLKIVDIDGKYTYSRLVHLSFKLGKNVINSIFPNPVKDRIQVEFEFIKEQILPYSIYDVNGIVVSKGTFAGHTGINYSSINTETFASGVYFLRLEGQTSMDLKRFVKF